MAVTRRGRQHPVTERAIEEFAARAEQGTAPVSNEAEVPTRKPITREPKTAGINFRMTDRQMALLRTASAEEDISQQKVLERIVWPILEERYGVKGD